MSPRPPLRDTGFRSRRSASGSDWTLETLDNDVLFAKLESRRRPGAHVAPKCRLSFLEFLPIDSAVRGDLAVLVAHRVHADGEESVALDEMLERVERFGEKAAAAKVVIWTGGGGGGYRLL